MPGKNSYTAYSGMSPSQIWKQSWGRFWNSVKNMLGTTTPSGLTNSEIDRLRKLGINITKDGEVPVNMFRAAPMSALPSNAMQVFNGIRNMSGAAVDFSNNSGTLTIAAGNLMRTQQITDVGTIVSTLSTSNDTLPLFSAMRSYMDFDSASQFFIAPFVVVMENGESITASDYNGNNIGAAVLATLTGDRSLYFGPAIRSQMYDANGTIRYRAKLNLDYSFLANAFSAHYARMKLEEEDPLVCQIGLCCVGIAAQQVAYRLQYVRVYANIQRELGI